MWQFWLIASGVFFIAEIFTTGFLIFWLGVAALISMIVSFFVDNLIIQATVFVLSSAILLFATRRFVNKFVHNKKTIPTNFYSFIGQEGIVVEDINLIEATGQVKVGGEVWSASCKGNVTIPKGTKIKVLEVNGVKLLVEPIQEPASSIN